MSQNLEAAFRLLPVGFRPALERDLEEQPPIMLFELRRDAGRVRKRPRRARLEQHAQNSLRLQSPLKLLPADLFAQSFAEIAWLQQHLHQTPLRRLGRPARQGWLRFYLAAPLRRGSPQ